MLLVHLSECFQAGSGLVQASTHMYRPVCVCVCARARVLGPNISKTVRDRGSVPMGHNRKWHMTDRLVT